MTSGGEKEEEEEEEEGSVIFRLLDHLPREKGLGEEEEEKESPGCCMRDD